MQLFKSTAIVGSMTFISRIMGFIRDMLFARIFGVDAGTDAFFVAFKIPNFLRRLFAEGAFSQAFVPVLSEFKETKDKQAIRDFINRTGGTLALILMGVTIVGVAGAPLLIMAFAPGFLWEGRQFDLAVEMLRITFPYLFFISSVAFAGGILNTYGRFAVPAFTPVFLNICLIFAAVWVSPMMAEPITALAWGVFAAGIVQLLFQFPALWKLGLVPRLRFGFYDTGVKKIIYLMLPAIFGVSITQINLLFDTLIASFLASGSVSWLYFSDRLVEFPLGVFGIALATVILPTLSKSHAANDKTSFSHSLDWGLRWVFLIGTPSAIGLVILAKPVLSTLFQYNEFNQFDVEMAGQSLMAYSVGLLGFILVKVLVPGFTARQDMRTPVRIGILAMLTNMVLNVALVFHFKHAGLALATSLSAFINAGFLLSSLLRDAVYRPEPGWILFSIRIVFACGMMAFLLIYGVDTEVWYAWGMLERSWNLFLWITSGIVIYFVSLWVFGMRWIHLTIQTDV